MDTNEQIALLAHTVSQQGGQLDAMYAALTGILMAAKEYPAVAEFVGKRLEQHYSGHLANSQNESFMHAFELSRDLLTTASK
ncbi:hypothetical protein [Cupriavidus taiwanensis]|uniref:hypothetical protein n=1 Tax=Cupriavidus taiwanensis TaxID=164546 RepID=UPI000E10CD4E|nr:hypothetical protein [Cupriavidus taiwanensis]SOY56811.1 conserved hypothetical protein [Cupriavidus taiwanensis]SOY90713.1 conserved hypothetical protein [Cupriavidus taiwanensis]SOZ63518.1 conserved hypothetical protein [Cupriavidus taiwanensis]SOZ82531.1 conserved hypothetical protein [Cupriavidus taiwanensis]SOZ84403.1 conserved hypothetical protein [Cupriavidus taiwanensis]